MYITKEEIVRQTAFGLKKAEDSLKDTQSTWYNKKCS